MSGTNRRIVLAALGPGYLVAVGYMDPGNWAVDIGAGADSGYRLLVVVLIASFAAAFLQGLAVRLALATGRDLATLIRIHFPKAAVVALWLAAELAMVATDLAELVGSGVAFKLLFGWDLIVGTLIAAVASIIILALPSRTGRTPQWIVAALALTVAVCLALELVLVRPDGAAVAAGLRPSLDIVGDPTMLYLSLGIVGATIMPHNLYLHTGLAGQRAATLAVERTRALRLLTADSWFALTLAFLVNAAILILAGTVFYDAPAGTSAGIETAYRLLGSPLGPTLAGVLFAVALLAAGQSATTTGTMAGQMVIEGFLGHRLPRWVRGFITRSAALVPAVAVFVYYGERSVDTLLIVSQIVLSLALPLVLFPLLLLLENRPLMGALAPGPISRGLAWFLTVALTGLNLWLLIIAVQPAGLS